MRHSIFHRHYFVPCFFLCMVLFFFLTGFTFPFFRPSFQEFTEEIFRHELSENTLNLHFTLTDPSAYDIETSRDPSFGTVSRDSMQEELSYLEKCLKKLQKYKDSQLTDAEQLTLQILEWWLEGQLFSEPFYYYQEPLGPTLGIQAQLPVLLCEYRFQSREDIDTYLALLETLPEYFQQLADFEAEKSRQGLFMTDETLDKILSQCRQLTAADDSHLLIAGFPKRLEACDFLTEEEKITYEIQNRQMIAGPFVTAYENLCQALENLRGTGAGAKGLCHTPDGTAYYEYLLKYTVGTSMSTAAIRQLLEDNIETNYENILYALSQNVSLSFSGEKVMATATPEQILRTLQKKIEPDFPSAEEISWEIKEVPESLCEYLSPAFYMTPAMDEPQQNIIYINPAKEMDRTSLITTLAHEGYPGHLYQNSFENTGDYDPVRNLIYIGGYTEGWGLYSELYAYDFLGLSTEEATVLRSFSSLNYAICAILDLAIHTEGWTEEDCIEYLSSFGITDTGQVHELYQNILEEPANYLKYYLGYLEICKLKESALALSSEITLSDFHEWFLSAGPAPFSLLEERLHLLKVSSELFQSADQNVQFFALESVHDRIHHPLVKGGMVFVGLDAFVCQGEQNDSAVLFTAHAGDITLFHEAVDGSG